MYRKLFRDVTSSIGGALQNSFRSTFFHDNAHCFRSRFSFMSRSVLGLTAFGDRAVSANERRNSNLVGVNGLRCSDYGKYIDRLCVYAWKNIVLGPQNMLEI